MFEVEQLIEIAAAWIGYCARFISIVLIAAGIAVGVWKVLENVSRPDIKRYNQARLAFSRYLVLALEFMLAADLVATAVRPTWNDLGILAIVALIRTTLNFFLQREMKEEEAVVEKSE